MTTHIAMYVLGPRRASREALSFSLPLYEDRPLLPLQSKSPPSLPICPIRIVRLPRAVSLPILSYPRRRYRPFFHRLSFRRQTINTRTASSRHSSVARAPTPPQSRIVLSFPFSANQVVSQLALTDKQSVGRDRVRRSTEELVCMR